MEYDEIVESARSKISAIVTKHGLRGHYYTRGEFFEKDDIIVVVDHELFPEARALYPPKTDVVMLGVLLAAGMAGPPWLTLYRTELRRLTSP